MWREELGDDWENVWETYRHTLGNLTLTGYNSEYANRSRCQPWRAKRRLVDPSSREAALLTRRAHSARGEAK
ncbi:GmrSD restriction endonuclease domain-containing protein [Thiolapillus sp.]|uniref:GmrSD restriction endonuclease domain-containing protein n=1 Tax=Thiolapillus sp. TaxID=2017437 RepID=UPI003AF899E5